MTRQPLHNRLLSSISLNNLSKALDILQSFLTILGIACAAWWFFVQAESAPKLNIKHTLTHKRIHNDWVWIYATTTLTNQGKTPVYCHHSKAWVQKILPLDEKFQHQITENHRLTSDKGRIEWPVIGDIYDSNLDVQIDPGAEQTINFEFLVPSYIEVIRFYTGFPEDGSEHGWSLASVYDLKDSQFFHDKSLPSN
jgi:hypothetical protein